MAAVDAPLPSFLRRPATRGQHLPSATDFSTSRTRFTTLPHLSGPSCLISPDPWDEAMPQQQSPTAAAAPAAARRDRRPTVTALLTELQAALLSAAIRYPSPAYTPADSSHCLTLGTRRCRSNSNRLLLRIPSQSAGTCYPLFPVSLQPTTSAPGRPPPTRIQPCSRDPRNPRFSSSLRNPQSRLVTHGPAQPRCPCSPEATMRHARLLDLSSPGPQASSSRRRDLSCAEARRLLTSSSTSF